MTPVYIGLGSNLGDRVSLIQQALDLLGERLRLVAVSPLYETAPMYVENQPPFLNGVLAAETDLGPLEVLRFLKETEARVGRLPRERYGPREIDLDLVAYGRARYEFRDEGNGTRDEGRGTRDEGAEIGDRRSEIRDEERGTRDEGGEIGDEGRGTRDAGSGAPAVLILPHPRTAERRFVLQPLHDVARDFVLPGVGEVHALLDATSDQAGTVQLVTHAVLSLRR